MHDPFDYYPASSGQIRAAAEGTQSTGTAVRDLMSQVESDHQVAVAAVDGAMRTQVASSPGKAEQAAQFINQKIAWAACQLEDFADAVDVYDRTSVQPRSVSRLNSAYWTGYASNFGQGLTHPMGPWKDEAQMRAANDKQARVIAGARQTLMDSLRAEYLQLDSLLDAAATRVSDNLRREPTEAEVRAAWKAGNLPLNAALAWPDLHLATQDISSLPADLSSLSDGELADWILAHPAMDPEVYKKIAATREGAISIIATRFEDWKLTSHDNQADLAAFYAAWPLNCPIMGWGGVVVGPDGRPYAVTLPVPQPPCPPGQTCLDAATGIPDSGPGSGWTTLGTKDGVVKVGDDVDWKLTTAYVIAGTADVGAPAGDVHSIGENQGDYVILRPDGSAVINDGTHAPTPAPEAPIILPPEDDIWTHTGQHANVERVQGTMDVLIGALQGASNAQQAKNDQTFASQVVFQENVNGDRRAIINLYQVQSDGEELYLREYFGLIDNNGNLIPGAAR